MLKSWSKLTSWSVTAEHRRLGSRVHCTYLWQVPTVHNPLCINDGRLLRPTTSSEPGVYTSEPVISIVPVYTHVLTSFEIENLASNQNQPTADERQTTVLLAIIEVDVKKKIYSHIIHFLHLQKNTWFICIHLSFLERWILSNFKQKVSTKS